MDDKINPSGAEDPRERSQREKLVLAIFYFRDISNRYLKKLLGDLGASGLGAIISVLTAQILLQREGLPTPLWAGPLVSVFACVMQTSAYLIASKAQGARKFLGPINRMGDKFGLSVRVVRGEDYEGSRANVFDPSVVLSKYRHKFVAFEPLLDALLAEAETTTLPALKRQFHALAMLIWLHRLAAPLSRNCARVSVAFATVVFAVTFVLFVINGF